MIRISSQQIFSGGINRLQELNTSLNNTQQQISTGQRVNKPSDDPVAAARILKLDQELSRVETYQRNVDLAENRLNQEESALESSIDVIQRIRELTVQAGNGSLSANDRRSISSELEERLGQLANIANTRDASGEFIFSGFQGSVKAFEQNEFGSWTYQGDEGQRVLEIDDGVTVPISDNGKDIFVRVPAAVTGENTSVTSGSSISGVSLVNEADLKAAFPGTFPDDITIQIDDNGAITASSSSNPSLPVTPNVYVSGEPFEVAGVEATITGPLPTAPSVDSYTLKINEKQSVFGTIENLIAGLNSIDKSSPGGQAEYDDLIANSLINLDNAQESILLKQTELGGRMNAVESTKTFLEDSSVYTNEIRSQLQDLDYAEAISNLSFQSFVLQAAQQSFAQVSQLSLFDRL
ncbi:MULTISPECIES: flagellar hook-associated protein FlgL [Marinobacter]|uniref:flagellar hook-associated protein FlgL n=1 Tax=Marinobacter TaxID=2742 RepID=UPI000B339DB3|nr:flagellar hook-associated protein FlgL [Marinobacter sp.]MBO6811451.1 flagellar hook-associated protein FlgL [Marinobacter sp.]MBO6874928.1 flagellar hook-associated protein FlgL [Marinobacter sp.]